MEAEIQKGDATPSEQSESPDDPRIAIARTITKCGASILRLLGERPGQTAMQIARVNSFCSNTVTATMKILEEGGLIARTAGRRGKEAATWVLTSKGGPVNDLLVEQPDLARKSKERGSSSPAPVTVEETAKAAEYTRKALCALRVPPPLAYAEDELRTRLRPSIYNAFLCGQDYGQVLETYQKRIDELLPLVEHARRRPSVRDLLGFRQTDDEEEEPRDFYRREADLAEEMERVDSDPQSGEEDLPADELDMTEFDDEGKPIPRVETLPEHQSDEETEPASDDDRDDAQKNTERKRIVEARRGEKGSQLRLEHIFAEARRIYGIVSGDGSSARLVQEGKNAVRRYLAINRIDGDDSEHFLAELCGEAVTDTSASAGASRKQDDAEKARTWRRALREFQKHGDPCVLLALETAPDAMLRAHFQCGGNALSSIHAALVTIGVRRLSSGEFIRDRSYFVRILHTALVGGNAHALLQLQGASDAWLKENPRVTDETIRAANAALRSIGYRRMEDGKIQRLPPSRALRLRKGSRSKRKGVG